MYPPHPQKITERDRVLFKKFGSDLPPSQHQMNNPPVSPTSKPTPTDQSWQDLHFPVQNGGGMEDGLGGVMLAFSGSGEGSMTGSSRKKAKPDTGIAPWLSDAGDFGEPHASSSSTTSMTTPKLSHSPSAPHLSASSPGEPSSKISSRSPVNLISRSRPSNASSLLSSPVNDRTRPASKSAKGGISGSGEKSPPGVPPVVPEEKRKKSVFSGLGLMKRKTPAVAKGKDDAPFGTRSTSIASTIDSITHHHRSNTSGLALPPLSSIHPSKPFASSSSRIRDPSPITQQDDLKRSSRKKKKSSSSPGTDDRTETGEFVNAGASPGIFTLDTDLDHMEGIVNTNMSAGSGMTTPGGAPFSMAGAHPVTSSGSSSNSVDSRTGFPHADGSISSHSSHPGSGSNHRGGSGSDAGSDPRASLAPPFNLPSQSSPKGFKGNILLPLNQPRRPSQLRNVNSSAEEYDENPFDQIQPVSANSLFSSSTAFSDPFSSSRMTNPSSATLGANWEVDPTSPGTSARSQDGNSPNDSLSPRTLLPAFISTGGATGPSTAPPIPPAGAAQGAWIAPESWGVEGDQEDEASLSSEEDDEELGAINMLGASLASRKKSMRQGSGGDVVSRAREDSEGSLVGSRNASLTHGIGGSMRPMTSGSTRSAGTFGGRPGTGTRPSTGGRMGTSTSGTLGLQATTNLRIYRADGTYSTIPCSLSNTTPEIVQILMSRGNQAKASYKLYIRERNNERPLDGRERPALIQKRRLIQAGFDESDRLEDMGKEDLSMICRFVYRMPELRAVNSGEEDAFDSFEYVDLSGKDLQVFPIFLHRHAHTIVHLNLSKNTLQELPSDFIIDCTTLRELRMSHMFLKKVPPSIRLSASLTRLDVSCNRIGDLDSAGLDGIPGLMSLKVQNNRLSVLPAHFAQLRSLKYLNISNNSFDAFPAIICEIKSLVDLDLSFNAISHLPPEIGKLVNLERLAIVGNTIDALPAEFARLENLRELDCRRNRLSDLSLAYALPRLEYLKAETNDVVAIEPPLFGTKIKELNLCHNLVTKISLATLEVPPYGLTVLNLSFTKLTSIPAETMGQLVSLTSLKLDCNRFEFLPDTIDRLVNLRELHCTDNVLKALPEGLARLQKLETLNLHNNNLTTLPSSIWFLSSLETLNASSNLIENFPDPPETFSAKDLIAALDDGGRKLSTGSGTKTPIGKTSLPLALKLRELLIADNRLTDDVFHPVSLLSELQTLNLSFNDILEIPPWTLRKNRSLVALYLSGNQLTSLPAEDLGSENLRGLRVLHINGNKLQSLPAELSMITRLTVLDVGSNVLKYNINNWRYDWNWSKNIQLRYFNLSGNKRLEIKPAERVHENSMVNNVKSDYLANFSTLGHLRILGLMDITLRIPLPDESDDRRVRTSYSDVNNMAYGISDTLGKYEHLLLADMVVPSFRGKDTECLFGIFGAAYTMTPSVISRVPRFLAEYFSSIFADELAKLRPGETVPDALRRSFLLLNKSCYDSLTSYESGGRKGSQASTGTSNGFGNAGSVTPQNAALLRTGGSGIVAYIADRTLYVANAGLALAVVSRKGTAELLSYKHEPFERSEAGRIRAAEGWISPKGLLNEDLDMSRGFGFYHLLPSLTARPDVRTYELSESDEFIIIANKGVWDFMSYQTAVDIACREKDDPMMAAQKLRDFALSYGADNSIMVMIVAVGDLFSPRTGPTRGGARQAVVDESFGSDGYYRKRQRGKDEIGDRTLARLDREIPPPTGMVALVFTDIKNSTALWETNVGMQTAIRMHNSLLRRQLRIIGGYEVKTEGDAFMVSFPTVASALLWCFSCQLMLITEEWPKEIVDCEDGREIFNEKGELIYRGIWVRMGIHWGAPACEADPITKRMDYFGPIVNRAARISGSADGGQIMVSEDVVQEIQSVYDSLEAQAEQAAKVGEDEAQSDEIARVEAEEKLGPHIAQLRKLGFGISYVGEKKLKGLERPEKLSLVYPTALASRLAFAAQKETVTNVQTFEPKAGLVNVEEVRQLASICIRLEALSSSGRSLFDTAGSPSTTMRRGEIENRASRYVSRNPDLLLPHLTIEMTDEDLLAILDSLSVRIENSLSTLYFKQLGGFSSVLASLGQGLAMDTRLITHALGLFSNLLYNPEP